MRRLHGLGLEVHITEMDIKCVPKGSSKPCTPELLDAQAKLYADILGACLEAPNCKSFETWGFTVRRDPSCQTPICASSRARIRRLREQDESKAAADI